MDRNDLLYHAINNYFAIQTMNSFCSESILEADMTDAQKIPLDMYSNLIPLFNSDSNGIEEVCDNIKLLSRLNINCFTNFCSEQLDETEQDGFIKEVNDCLKKYCDEDENFVFTTDAYCDIMKTYWIYERKSVSRRFDNGNK